MAKKDQNKQKEKVVAVLELLRKQSQLTVKQEKFCNSACVERFLKAKGDSVKKAAKHLRACLSWRESTGTENLIADEFSAELSEGVAYVAGHDDESRPVMVFRINQDYQKFHSQKLFTRLLAFTLEVAIGTMQRGVEQFVLLFDASFAAFSAEQGIKIHFIWYIQKFVGAPAVSASKLSESLPELPSIHHPRGPDFGRLKKGNTGIEKESRSMSVFQVCEWPAHGVFRSASAFLNLLLGAMKIVGEYYPGRLHKAFVIDPPSLFSYLWKGVRPFMDLSPSTVVVSSADFEDSFGFGDFSDYPRASSLRFDPSSTQSTAKIGSCSSSRFTFTVSHHFDSLKPWYLSFADTSASKVGPTSSLLGPALISPLNARSLSFASPSARTPPPRSGIHGRNLRFTPSTPMPEKATKMADVANPRTPRPSFFQSPATFFRKGECQVSSSSSKGDRSRDSFVPFLKFYRRPYDEMTYRSKMRPPLGGLVSIVHPQLSRRHASLSQRF